MKGCEVKLSLLYALKAEVAAAKISDKNSMTEEQKKVTME